MEVARPRKLRERGKMTDGKGGRGRRGDRTGEADAGGRRWRLTWRVTPPRLPGGIADPDARAGAFVASDDPGRIKAFAAAQPWSADEELAVALTDDRGTVLETVSCGPAELAAWRPADALLPDAVDRPPRLPSRSESRLALLAALRRAVDAAVAADVLGRDEAAGLMLTVADLLERRAAAENSRPAADIPPDRG